MEENNLNIAPIQPEIPVVPENIAPPAPAPKPQSNSILIIFSILLIIFVGIMAFLGYQNWSLQKQITTLQNIPSPTPTSTTDPTANWLIYTAPDGSFSFKYPGDLGTPKEEKLQNIQQTSFGNTLTVASRSALTLDKFIATNLPTDKTPPVDYVNENIIGKKLIYTSGVDQATVDTVIAFSGQSQNVITFSYTDSPGHITKSETIDQILSTFKFTGPTSSLTATPTVSKTATPKPTTTPTPTLTNNTVNNPAPTSQTNNFSIKVNYPNGGESLKVATNVNISWSSTGSFSFFKLYYFDCAGCAGTYITTVNGSQNSYVWYINIGGVSLPHQEKIRIVGQRSDTSEDTPTDESDNYFTVTN